MRIAVTGAQGQLGAAIVEEFGSSHDVVPLGRADLDVTDDVAVAAVLDAARPDVVINCASYNDVDGAEDHPLEALSVNAIAVRALARAAGAIGATLVHYSTDFVFDGNAAAPYTETDAPNPCSNYAAAKLVGEWFALDMDCTYVLRVESLFGRTAAGRPAKGSVAAILNSLLANGEAKVFEDRTVSPTYVMDIARATRSIVERRIESGLYHCVNSGHCSWLEFAQELARQLGITARLVPVRMADVPMRAPRPRYCALSNDKLARAGVTMPTWQDAVVRYLHHLRNDLAHPLANR